MCWMTVQTGDGCLDGALDCLREHERANGHSWGVAVAVDGDLTTRKGLGHAPSDIAATLRDAAGLDADESPDGALAHTRFATAGEVSHRNAHPFGIENDDGETVAVLAHNGTWYDAPIPWNSSRCDSYFIARELERRYQTADRISGVGVHAGEFRQLVKETGEYVGETITVLHRDGTGYCYSGRFDITEGDGPERPWWEEFTPASGFGYVPDGGDRRHDALYDDDDDGPAKIRSSGGEPIPTGEVKTI